MLGKKVIIIGVSAGSIVAAWAGQMRSDIETVVLITPVFYSNKIPFTRPIIATRLLLLMPNMYHWFDPVLKEEGTPQHIYPRYASRPVGELLRLNLFVQKMIHSKPPLAKNYTIITNANDSTIDRRMTNQYISQLKKHGVSVTTYEFPKRLQLGSDIIDPSRTDEQVKIVYPQVVKMVLRR